MHKRDARLGPAKVGNVIARLKEALTHPRWLLYVGARPVRMAKRVAPYTGAAQRARKNT
jgi:hypothetical protein